MHMYTLNTRGGGGGGEGICGLIRTASKCYLTHTKVQACSFTARDMFKSVITTSVIIQCTPTRIRIVFSGCQVEEQ